MTGHGNELFEYSRGRFLLDEKEQMARRRINFNIEELASTAAKAIGAAKCVDVKKCPDGLYNKAYILTMDNGKQVIGKIPNPNAGIPYYTTASEVATMDFARNVLQTPAPQVYDWNATSSADNAKNPVGAEFIIMEMMPGVPLSDMWWNLQPNEKLKIFRQIARYQRRWANIKFNQLGSLYYAEQVHSSLSLPSEHLYVEDGDPVSSSRFVVGPSCGRDWSDEGRNNIQHNRGPWNSIMDYREAISNREAAAVDTLGHIPKQMVMVYGPPPLYQPTADKKLEALRYYFQILQSLVPKDPALTGAHLWHNDLHHENIFVEPDSLEVLGIIDWQSIRIVPLTDHRLDPSFLDYDGPDVGDDLEQPQIPDEIDSLQGDEKTNALNRFMERAVMIAWRRLIRDKNQSQYSGIKFQQSTQGHLLHLSSRIFELGEAHFRALLLDLRDEWAKAGDASQSQLIFSDAQTAAIEADLERAELGVKHMKAIQARLGEMWPEKGLVEHENYEEVKAVLRQAKEDLISQYADCPGWDTEVFERLWPFDD